MDIKTITDSIWAALSEQLPGILGALAILILGWIAALLVRAVVRRGLGLLKLNERIESATGKEIDVQGGVAKGVFWAILFLALIAFFNIMNLGLVSGPLQSLVDDVLGFMPRLAAGVSLLLVAWVLATFLKRVTIRGLGRTEIDEKLSAEAGMPPVSESLGNVLYWLVFLLFLPATLGVLELSGLLLPVQNMIDEIVGMIPNLFAAAVIGVVGWLVARLLRDLVSNLLAATGIDGLGQRAGLSDKMPLSKLAGLLVFIFTFVPALIAALDAMHLDAISAPATEMLGTFMATIPNLFAATFIVILAYYVARFAANLVRNLLAGMGYDSLPEKLGIAGMFSGNATLSSFTGSLVVFFTMLFATVEAADILGLQQVSDMVQRFLGFGSQVLLGTVIIAIGLWIANFAHRAVVGLGGSNSVFLAGLARFTILAMVLAMGLRAMGIADDIVDLAFGLTLGAVAVAVALSFGLGGREAAGKQMSIWLARLRGEI